MLAGFPKTDVLGLIMAVQGGYCASWGSAGLKSAPPGELVPFWETDQDYRGFIFDYAGGSHGLNPFCEGGAVGSPGTYPTGFTMVPGSVGVSTEVIGYGTIGETYQLTIKSTGAPSGAGIAWQLNFGDFSTPSSLPTGAVNQNWVGDIHIMDIDYSDPSFDSSSLTAALVFQPFDAANNPLTPLVRPITPIIASVDSAFMADSRKAVRSGLMPANTARVGMALRVDATGAGGHTTSRLGLTLPMYRRSVVMPGILPGPYTTGLTSNGQVTTNATFAELANINRWMNQEAGTFHIKFRIFPLPDEASAAARGVLTLTNFDGASHFTIRVGSLNSPSLQVWSQHPTGDFIQTLLTNAVTPNTWCNIMVSYRRGTTTRVASVACLEGGSPTTVQVNEATAITPFLFGILGAYATANYRVTNYPLGGAINFFDYYPFDISDEEMLERVQYVFTP